MNAGLCSYPDLIGGKIRLRDFFDMLRIVDWNDYLRARAEALARADQGRL